MKRRLPATQPAARVIHYMDTAAPAELSYPHNPARLAARRREGQVLYGHWAERQAAIAERDRKVRRFWLGFGIVIALAVLGGLFLAGWLLWQAMAAIGMSALAIPAVIGLLLLLGVGGHKCVTVVQHWH